MANKHTNTILKMGFPIIYDNTETPLAAVIQLNNHRVFFTLKEATEDEIIELINNISQQNEQPAKKEP